MILKDSDAKILPWKNGGGTTRELYRLPNPNNSEEFLLRISIASVNQAGPFSEFRHIDRILCLLEGKGMHLQFEDKTIDLKVPLFPIFFKGEEKIDCTLIEGGCSDFNVMVDRRYGRASLEINSMTLEEATKLVSDQQIFIYQDQKQNLFLIKYQSLITK